MLSPNQVRSQLIRFFLLALGATAALHGSLVVFGLQFSFSPFAPSSYLYLAGLAMPSLAALLIVGSGARRAFLRSLLTPRGSLQLYLVAIFAQAGLVALAWLLLSVFGTPSAPRFSVAPGFVVLSIGQIWVVFGEELGWRGFALPRLEFLLSPRQATVALAAAWGLWHTPMFFVVDSLQAQVSPWLFAASILAWSAIHTALYHRAGPSVLPNLVFHAGANLTLTLGLIPVELELYLLVAYVLVALAVLVGLRPSVAPSTFGLIDKTDRVRSSAE